MWVFSDERESNAVAEALKIFAVDSGTPNIIGSLEQVRTVLQIAGYNITEQTTDDVTVALVRLPTRTDQSSAV